MVDQGGGGRGTGTKKTPILQRYKGERVRSEGPAYVALREFLEQRREHGEGLVEYAGLLNINVIRENIL